MNMFLRFGHELPITANCETTLASSAAEMGFFGLIPVVLSLVMTIWLWLSSLSYQRPIWMDSLNIAYMTFLLTAISTSDSLLFLPLYVVCAVSLFRIDKVLIIK